MAAQIEAGTLELTLRDIGGVDLAVAQYARSQNVSREAAGSSIVDSIRAGGEKAAAANPDAAAAVEALARFVETPGQTLTIKLTPLGKVPALQLDAAVADRPVCRARRNSRSRLRRGCELSLVRQVEPDVKLAQLLGGDFRRRAHHQVLGAAGSSGTARPRADSPRRRAASRCGRCPARCRRAAARRAGTARAACRRTSPRPRLLG